MARDSTYRIPAALELAPRPSARAVVEASIHADCTRTPDGVAICDGVEVARDVRSVEAAPYLLRNDGSVVVAPNPATKGKDDDVAIVKDEVLRREAMKTVPPFTRLVNAERVTCGLTRTGEVWCWAEPSYNFNRRVEVGLAPRPRAVPGLADVVDLSLMPWHTLCALTRAGAVLCSRAGSKRTAVCELRGQSDVRCGETVGGPIGPPPLAGPGHDPRRLLERPLVAVPGLDGADPAKDLHAWTRYGYGDRESERRVYVSDFDEGGCAVLASGAVRCWERDLCAKDIPWRSAVVEGLPPAPARIALGMFDGYAITPQGELYTWAKRVGRGGPHDDCTQKTPAFALRAEKVPLDAPVAQVAGGPVVLDRRPGWHGVDCAVTTTGTPHCFASNDRDRTPITVTTVRPSGTAPTPQGEPPLLPLP